MANASAMSHDDDDKDDHVNDVVMPGFRFHPTEEELIEFYLRRKVEGKRFNVELITFLDLYRYDPWELPGLTSLPQNNRPFSPLSFVFSFDHTSALCEKKKHFQLDFLPYSYVWFYSWGPCIISEFFIL